MVDRSDWDVVICGGGLAGLTLARQLRLYVPQADTLILEKQPRPLPAACHKVGESLVEGSAHYLRDVLKLRDYIGRTHIKKFGLRFFGGKEGAPLEDLWEFGPVIHLPLDSYQVDRGVLENDLRGFNDELRIPMVEGAVVEDIQLGRGDSSPHTVVFADGAGRIRRVTGRWVVDAMGWRRYQQVRSGSDLDSGHLANACWWRIRSEKDISELVPRSNSEFHGRIRESRRWHSTTHIMGEGYWIWIIPLCSGYTSIGIVADENLHPIAQRSTFRRALAWMGARWPQIAEWLSDDAPADFHAFRDYAHFSKQVFSPSRWATVGVAGCFTDALYSIGGDLIAWSNTIVAHLIEKDLAGETIGDLTALYNRLYLSMVDFNLEFFRNTFFCFRNDRVLLTKILWDGVSYFAYFGRILVGGLLDQPQLLPQLIELAERFLALQKRVQQLFRDWAANTGHFRVRPGHRPVPVVPPEPFDKVLLSPRIFEQTPDDILQDLRRNLTIMEEMAVCYFQRALQDVHPEVLVDCPEPFWVDPASITLDRSQWKRKGLFTSDSEPRDFSWHVLVAHALIDNGITVDLMLQGMRAAGIDVDALMPKSEDSAGP